MDTDRVFEKLFSEPHTIKKTFVSTYDRETVHELIKKLEHLDPKEVLESIAWIRICYARSGSWTLYYEIAVSQNDGIIFESYGWNGRDWQDELELNDRNARKVINELIQRLNRRDYEAVFVWGLI